MSEAAGDDDADAVCFALRGVRTLITVDSGNTTRSLTVTQSARHASPLHRAAMQIICELAHVTAVSAAAFGRPFGAGNEIGRVRLCECVNSIF